MRKSDSIILFLVGMLSMTQLHIIGAIGISELFVFIVAPIIYITRFNDFRNKKFGMALGMALILNISCLYSCYSNESPFDAAARGVAGVYALLAWMVFLFRYLGESPLKIKWFLVGYVISITINLFVFQTGADMGVSYQTISASELLDKRILALSSRVREWLELPINCWYLQVPTSYSVIAILIGCSYAFFTTISGRSAFVMGAMSAIFVFIGRKKQSTMYRISKFFWVILVAMMSVVAIFKLGYSYAAKNGLLSAGAEQKYEAQTKEGDSLLKMLMNGRVEFFAGLYANLQQPFSGYGPWALDEEGLYEGFLLKYGGDEDLKNYYSYMISAQRLGYAVLRRIPMHSHIVGYWTWYGIGGLIFWIYVLWLLFVVMRKYMHVVPALFGYLALMIPSMAWGIFFSATGSRCIEALAVVMLVIVKNIGEGKLRCFDGKVVCSAPERRSL